MKTYIVFSLEHYLKNNDENLELGEAFFEYDEIIRLIVDFTIYSFYGEIYYYELNSLEDYFYYMWGECKETTLFIETFQSIILNIKKDLVDHIDPKNCKIIFIINNNDVILRN